LLRVFFYVSIAPFALVLAGAPPPMSPLGGGQRMYRRAILPRQLSFLVQLAHQHHAP
jgi:hypothetical protein